MKRDEPNSSKIHNLFLSYCEPNLVSCRLFRDIVEIGAVAAAAAAAVTTLFIRKESTQPNSFYDAIRLVIRKDIYGFMSVYVNINSSLSTNRRHQHTQNVERDLYVFCAKNLMVSLWSY